MEEDTPCLLYLYFPKVFMAFLGLQLLGMDMPLYWLICVFLHPVSAGLSGCIWMSVFQQQIWDLALLDLDVEEAIVRGEWAWRNKNNSYWVMSILFAVHFRAVLSRWSHLSRHSTSCHLPQRVKLEQFVIFGNVVMYLWDNLHGKIPVYKTW